MKEKSLKVLLWVLTIFMLLSAAVYFPSVASIIMLLFAAIAIPLEPVRNFWKGKKLAGPTKGILLANVIKTNQKKHYPPIQQNRRVVQFLSISSSVLHK